MPQDRPDCIGSPPLKAPRGTSTGSAQFGDLWRKTTGNGADGHHRRNCGYNRETTVGVSGARRGGLNKPTTLDSAVWGGEYGAQAYFWGIQELDVQRSPTLGGLQGTGVGTPHWPQQVPWCKYSRRGGEIASDIGKVHYGCDGGGGQGVLRCGSALR